MSSKTLKVGDIVTPIMPTARQLKLHNGFFRVRANMVGIILESPTSNATWYRRGDAGVTVKWLKGAVVPCTMPHLLRKVC